MWAAFTIAALGMLPTDSFVVEGVDRIEVNHVYDCAGNLVIDQIIFWNWNARESRFDCVDWRLLRGVRMEVSEDQRQAWRRAGGHDSAAPLVGEWRAGHAYPRKDHASGMYVSQWYDEKSQLWRCVIARIFLETWTSHDRELVVRKLLPQSKRRRLKQVSKCEVATCKIRDAHRH